MADLPTCRVTPKNKPFKFYAADYLGPYISRQNRSNCKAWGLLFTCLCTPCIHAEIVTGLDLNNFVLAFLRFTNLRGEVDTIYSDNGSTTSAGRLTLYTQTIGLQPPRGGWHYILRQWFHLFVPRLSSFRRCLVPPNFITRFANAASTG